jgi:N-acetylneuraminate synthase
MQNSFKIGKIKFSRFGKPVVIAEIGINHGGKLSEAIKLSNSAIKAGAKIIKHQTHIPDDEMSYHAKKITPRNSKLNIYKLINKCALSETDELKLMNFVKSKNVEYLSTPFSKKAVDRLVKFKVKAFKIGSGECNNYPLIEYICKFNKPIIISTGMNNIKSIDRAVKIIEKYKIKYAILHCTSLYPTPNKFVNLNFIKILKNKYKKAIIGFSDHSKGVHNSLASVALGSSIIEKHFTDTFKRNGPDIRVSIDQSQLKRLIEESQNIFESMQFQRKDIIAESSTKKFAYASIVTVKKINKNSKFSLDNLWVKRPGTGEILAKDLYRIIGKTAKKNINTGEQLKKAHVKNL